MSCGINLYIYSTLPFKSLRSVRVSKKLILLFSKHKDIYNVTKDFCYKCCSFGLSIHQRIVTKCTVLQFPEKLLGSTTVQDMFLEHQISILE